jgi:hypothetical protein
VLACYDHAGDLAWVAKEPPSPNPTWGKDVACDHEGNVYMAVTDYFGNYNSLYRFYLVKYSAQGSRLWATAVSEFGMIVGLCVDDHGSSYITGVTHSPLAIGSHTLSKSGVMFLANS